MDLASYYQIIFNMKQHHSWSVDEIEMMYPWEREIYIGLLKIYIEEEKQRLEQKKNG